MSILDKRAEQLHVLDRRSHEAQTFCGWLNLEQEKEVLAEALRSEYTAVNRLAQGWTFIPPSTRKP